MLPRLGGFDVMRELRRRGIETAVVPDPRAGQVVDKIVGLKTGADDYVTKPFEMMELLARRMKPTTAGAATAPNGHRLPRDPHGLSQGRDKAGQPLELSARFQLLRSSSTAARRCAREELLNEVWGYNSMPSTRTVDVHVAWLRKRDRPNSRHPQYSGRRRDLVSFST